MLKWTSFLLFISLITLFSCEKKAQNLPEVLYIHTQEDIDKYTHLLEGTKIFNGSISFENENAFDLLSVLNIEYISGNLSVSNQEQLDAFERLKKVGGIVIGGDGELIINNIEEIEGILIASKATRISAPSLKKLGVFILNGETEELGDFSNLEFIGKISMQYANVLSRIEDFSKLEYVEDFRLNAGDIEILENAFSSLKKVDIFRLTYFEEDKEFDLKWVSGIDEFQDFSIAGSFEKKEICQYVYPIRNNSSNKFSVIPSLELIDSLGLTIFESLGPLSIEQLCE